jgi:hypothetical protein
MSKRPISVLLVALLYIAVGVIGFTYHFTDLYAKGAFHYNGLLVELTELCAFICGAFMLRGQNWARWLALAWIAFHVILSAFHALQPFVIHCVLCGLIAWAVFRPQAGRYFSERSSRSMGA